MKRPSVSLSLRLMVLAVFVFTFHFGSFTVSSSHVSCFPIFINFRHGCWKDYRAESWQSFAEDMDWRGDKKISGVDGVQSTGALPRIWATGTPGLLAIRRTITSMVGLVTRKCIPKSSIEYVGTVTSAKLSTLGTESRRWKAMNIATGAILTSGRCSASSSSNNIKSHKKYRDYLWHNQANEASSGLWRLATVPLWKPESKNFLLQDMLVNNQNQTKRPRCTGSNNLLNTGLARSCHRSIIGKDSGRRVHSRIRSWIDSDV